MEKNVEKASDTQAENITVKESSSESSNLAVTGVYFK